MAAEAFFKDDGAAQNWADVKEVPGHAQTQMEVAQRASK